MPCKNACQIEHQQNDHRSIGPIVGEEYILRGMFFRGHGNPKTGNIKDSPQAGFLPIKQIANSELSVWRWGEDPKITEKETADILVKRTDIGKLFAIFSAEVDAIRDIQNMDGERAFCILDGCDCGQGEHHPAHANIGCCQHSMPNLDDKNSDEYTRFVEVFRHLQREFLEKLVWTDTDDTREKLVGTNDVVTWFEKPEPTG